MNVFNEIWISEFNIEIITFVNKILNMLYFNSI
uniref:Uncharacterized protein n=1 Tax=Myoviridae sp. ctCo31 TaxID=2825053 RepID=A0A8S5UM75_9CAUD|nr:MAG TPA: hypothetical protein [Myoviridae sp. ctCo31]